VLGKVGGFNESLWPGEDVELDLRIRRLGFKLIFNPDAMVGHYRAGTWNGFAHMMKRYGEVQGKLVRKYGLFRLLHYVPLALAASVALLVAVLLAWPWAWPVLFVPPLGALVWFRLKARNFELALRFVALFFFTLVIWHYGFLAGSLYRDLEQD
jgi:hypothetical protein